MNIKKTFLKFKKSPAFSSVLLFAILVLLNALLQQRFFTPAVLKSNMMTFTPLILLAIAQAIIVISGSIDLSLGTTLTLINVTMASIMKDTPESILFAMAAGLGVAMVTALVNGLCIGVIKMPPMVATFATSSIWYGLSLLIMPQPGGYVPAVYYRFYQKTVFGIIPLSLLLVVFALFIWQFVKSRRMYRKLYAVGSDANAAAANGISVPKVKIAAFLLAGVFIALAAYAVTAQTASGDAHLGDAFALTSIAAIVIGGVSLAGGKGKILGAVLGACSLNLLINIIFFANIPSLYQGFIKGLIIIGSLLLSIIPNLKARKRTAIINS